MISPAHLLMTMTQDEQEHKEILHEIEALCIMHEKITQSSECREFNRRTASAATESWKTQDSPGWLTEPWISWPPAIPRTSPSATVCSGPGISWRG